MSALSENQPNISINVENRLKHIFKSRLDIEIPDRNEILFSSKIGLAARDLVYVMLDIEKEFNIAIDDDCIENHTLMTFSQIRDFILSRV